jgi:ribonuclease HI
MISIYTDGSCIRNPGGAGTYAFIVVENNNAIHQHSSWERSTTNNRMEMSAVLSALAFINEQAVGEPVTIHMDSSYVFNGCTSWMNGWRTKGYRRKGEPIPNHDLWKQIHELILNCPTVKFKWVRGHVNGEVWNNAVDTLCTAAYKGH